MRIEHRYLPKSIHCYLPKTVHCYLPITDALINDGKYVISIGAEHTVTNGFVRAHKKKYPNLAVLQIDAHSDLRESYHDNIYSHASVMKRIHDMVVQYFIVKIGLFSFKSQDAM